MPDIGKVGRNDLCPCGSGKKYKRCCMLRDKAAQAERVAWERAAQDMRIALIGFAREKTFVQDRATSLSTFWQDRYTASSIHLMSEDESLRFFDWFSHDYSVQRSDSTEADGPFYGGMRLIEAYRKDAADALSDKEAWILDGWIASPPGSAFVLAEVEPEQEQVVLRDLFIEGRVVTAQDAAAAKHGQAGQILLARPLPDHDGVHLAGATVVLPASEEEGLRASMARAREAYLEEHPEATEMQFLRDRAYLLTHYALEWADREDRPAVAVDDPEARGQGGQVLRKLVRWKQTRTRVR